MQVKHVNFGNTCGIRQLITILTINGKDSKRYRKNIQQNIAVLKVDVVIQSVKCLTVNHLQ